MDDREIKKHNQIKLTLKILGIAFIIIGALLAIIGFVDFFASMGSEDMHMPTKFWMLFVGLPLLTAGISMTVFAYRREITTYVKNESVPVINDTAKEITPAIDAITDAVKDSLEDGILCECGEMNDPGSKFCKACGKPLHKVCPKCGNIVDMDSKFCNKCGHEL